MSKHSQTSLPEKNAFMKDVLFLKLYGMLSPQMAFLFLL